MHIRLPVVRLGGAVLLGVHATQRGCPLIGQLHAGLRPCSACTACPQKMAKVKASDKLSFPLCLDLAPILASDAPAGAPLPAEGTQYELVSILIHKGPSASHGHYGAHVLLPMWHCPCSWYTPLWSIYQMFFLPCKPSKKILVMAVAALHFRCSPPLLVKDNHLRGAPVMLRLSCRPGTLST